MEYLALEIFDLEGTGSKYAALPEDASITIIDTSEIFASGDVWSHSFTLNVKANAHIFGTSGEIHGARLHDQFKKRKARLWVMGLPLYLGYLKLDDEVEVDKDGNVDVSFESGQKTFEEMIEGVSAREVSVGDVPIGVALNRKRVVSMNTQSIHFKLTGMEAYSAKEEELEGIENVIFELGLATIDKRTPYAQRWPKFVKSHGRVGTYENNQMTWNSVDYTNIQTPYDASHPFCNINICYPFKSLKTSDGSREEVAGRGYTLRSAHDNPTTDGGDNQTRYNNAPNFYLLYFIDRLFKDMGINITENQAKDMEDMRRVFMLNYGCFYEEIEDTYDSDESLSHRTPSSKTERYGQYYFPLLDKDDNRYLIQEYKGNGAGNPNRWYYAGRAMELNSIKGKVLVRNLQISKSGSVIFENSSVEGEAVGGEKLGNEYLPFGFELLADDEEKASNAYSAYLAYATGENYPNVEIGDIINAMKSMFGVRLLFNNDYSTVRIVMLKNILTNTDIQEIECDIIAPDIKKENSIRGFRMTYAKGTEDTSFYYKGFADMFIHKAKTWKDTTDKHDYTQWDLNADYNEIKQYVTAFNKICYVTPLTGNAYIVKIDEDEDVLFPSLFEAAPFMDAEDGDCSGEDETIEEVQMGASPVIMNTVGKTYASLFSGDMKAPSPEDADYAQQVATFARVTPDSYTTSTSMDGFSINGTFDVYPCEGFEIRMEDNYAISNGGTIFDEADPGLCFGIMRGSGENAIVAYSADPNEPYSEEGNETWDVVPGDGAIDHTDTCDDYGKLFDYDGQNMVIRTRTDAQNALQTLFPDSNAPFIKTKDSFEYAITGYVLKAITDSNGKTVNVLFAQQWGRIGVRPGWDEPDNPLYVDRDTINNYAQWFSTMPESFFMNYDLMNKKLIVEINSSVERGDTLLALCGRAGSHSGSSYTIYINNGVGSQFGRFSLKLRAEKPNPYFDPNQDETHYDPEHPERNTNPRYLHIDDENLQRRGLADRLYPEYSYFIRNARIVTKTVHMELAQLLGIDKTKRAKVGDIIGFIRKTQVTVSNKKGLGPVTMEIMYI